MKIVSWNVNGLKACARKGLKNFMKEEDADVYCFQEIKTSPENIKDSLKNIDDYESYWFPAEKKGYAGIVTYAKKEPLSVEKGMGVRKFDREGRVMTLEYEEFFLINAYFPNAGRGLKRLDYKLSFNKAFLEFSEGLREEKPLIICGDLNVAHKEKDLANPSQNTDNAGFTPEEREWFTKFLKKGYIDSFREYDEEGDNYTFWTYRYNAREKNIGWRLDYFIITEELKNEMKKSYILSDVKGSDHCPIVFIIK